jgi:hypothetical protein
LYKAHETPPLSDIKKATTEAQVAYCINLLANKILVDKFLVNNHQYGKSHWLDTGMEISLVDLWLNHGIVR